MLAICRPLNLAVSATAERSGAVEIDRTADRGGNFVVGGHSFGLGERDVGSVFTTRDNLGSSRRASATDPALKCGQAFSEMVRSALCGNVRVAVLVRLTKPIV